MMTIKHTGKSKFKRKTPADPSSHLHRDNQSRTHKWGSH
uniref:Uncharacterized protein n=1 Tax=Rhizophora mucronata TaxID=61149 RepID=A0A2P2NU53_RHIMU